MPENTPKNTPKPTLKEKADEVADKGAKGAWMIVSWGVPVLLIVLGLWFLFRPSSPAGDVNAPPEQIYDNYSVFVRPYRPPSSQIPSPGTVDTWLRFFDGSSRSWFDDNTDKLAFVGMRRNAQEWGDANRQRRRQEAMQYLLTQGPLGGGAVRTQRFAQEGERAFVEVNLLRGQATVPMTSSRSGWVFSEMMGMRGVLDQQMAGVTLP